MKTLMAVLMLSFAAQAQQWPYPYGAPIGVEAARKVAAAAVAESRKNGWKVAVAIVEPNGTLVYYEKMDDTQYGSAHVAIEKAHSSAQFRRPTKSFEDPANSGKPNILGLTGAVPLEGGLPIVVEGRVIGAVGVSGGTSAQDGVCAKAGAAAVGAMTELPAAPAKK